MVGGHHIETEVRRLQEGAAIEVIDHDLTAPLPEVGRGKAYSEGVICWLRYPCTSERGIVGHIAKGVSGVVVQGIKIV